MIEKILTKNDLKQIQISIGNLKNEGWARVCKGYLCGSILYPHQIGYGQNKDMCSIDCVQETKHWKQIVLFNPLDKDRVKRRNGFLNINKNRSRIVKIEE